MLYRYVYFNNRCFNFLCPLSISAVHTQSGFLLTELHPDFFWSLCSLCRSSTGLHVPDTFASFVYYTYLFHPFPSAKAVSGPHVVLIFESRPRLCSVAGTRRVWVCASFSVCSVEKNCNILILSHV